VNRRADEWLADILSATDAIARHLQRGPLEDPLVFDAVRVRIIEIGEAVRKINSRILDQEPHIPWRQIRDMRNRLAHGYFETDALIVKDVVDKHLQPLVEAVKRLR
jgi:uncharacterized protein with HEPN domain